MEGLEFSRWEGRAGVVGRKERGVVGRKGLGVGERVLWCVEAEGVGLDLAGVCVTLRTKVPVPRRLYFPALQ
jgi:hypothetical protein